MKGRWTIFLLLLGFSGLKASCGGSEPGSDSEAAGLSGKLVLTGSSTVAPLASEIGKRFEQLHPGVRVDVQTGGSSRGIADLRNSLADIGMVSRALMEEEEDLHSFTIAMDGVGIILHRDNPVSQLDRRQIMAIYTGEISRWSEVGGPDLPITVVNKAEGRATLEVFTRYFGLKNSQIQASIIIGDNEQGVKLVAGNRGAIGYVSIGTAEHDISLGIPIRLLSLDGVQASSETVSEGSFPLSRPLNLVTRSEPQGLAAQFIDFARSEEVYALIRKQDFVPLRK